MSAEGVATGAAFAALLFMLAALLFTAAGWRRSAEVACAVAAVLAVLFVAVLVTL